MERASDLLTMRDMLAVFGVTDAYSISREAVSVPLEKADPGKVHKVGPIVEIIVPVSVPIGEFAKQLSTELARLGFQKGDPDEE